MNRRSRVKERLPSPETLAWAGLLVTTEWLFVLGYLLAMDVTVRRPLLYIVPFVWINLAIWVFARVRPRRATHRSHRIAVGVAVGYGGLLAVLGGLVGPGGEPATGLRLAVTGLPPGWGPAILFDGHLVDVALLPYEVAGFLALGYLVYVTVCDAAGSAIGGLLGLLSCVSCTFPLVAGLVTGIAGSGTAIAVAVRSNAYLLSTGVFVLTVLLLSWRPTVSTPKSAEPS